MDKLLYNLQLVFSPSLKSTGVVENITVMLAEYEFVLNVMRAALRAGSSGSAINDKIKPAQPL
jgi:hypothetical protein